jgi:DNA-binding NarL/FixJ family response regulator
MRETKEMVKVIRVLLADDHVLVRAGIRALIEKVPGVEVCGEANDGRETLELAQALDPDVILIDIALPGLNGLETAARLTREFPRVKTIILSTHYNEEFVWRALRAGASGFLLKKEPATELEIALHRAMAGEIYLSGEISDQLRPRFPWQRIAHRKSPMERLTGRQREILQLIAEGLNTKRIADVMTLSPKTVEYHRMKLMKQLNIHNIPGLVRFALQMGVVSSEG